jgi:hypothetical protein
MRKVIAVIIAVLILSVPGLASAQVEHGEGMMDDKGIEKMDHGMMKRGMMGCPMMKHMMGPMVVATSDGGVVVVTGNQMTKYDQDLDVIGQAEIKMDMEAMKMMKAGCPMMGKEKTADEPQAAAAVEPAAAESATGTEPAAVLEPAAEVIPEAAAEPVAVLEPAADAQPEAVAEPAALVIEPATTEPSVLTNSTVPAEEGNNTDQK